MGELFFGGPARRGRLRRAPPPHFRLRSVLHAMAGTRRWPRRSTSVRRHSALTDGQPSCSPTTTSHGTLSRLARRSERDAVAKAAAVLLLTLRGTPFLYYGEEIGMADVRIPRAEIVDPPARRYWPLPLWRNRDAARAPLPWSADPALRTWMRPPADAATRNVARQAADPESVLAFYRRLLWLRRSSPALQSGDFGWEVRARDGILAYWRTTPSERVLVAINIRSTTTALPLPDGPGWRVELSTHSAGCRVGSVPSRCRRVRCRSGHTRRSSCRRPRPAEDQWVRVTLRRCRGASGSRPRARARWSACSWQGTMLTTGISHSAIPPGTASACAPRIPQRRDGWRRPGGRRPASASAAGRRADPPSSRRPKRPRMPGSRAR